MTTNAIIRKNELVSMLNFAELALKEVSAGKVMKSFKAVLGIVCKRRADFISAVTAIISKIVSELKEVEKDVTAIDGEIVKQEVATRTPIMVLVHWSESGVFQGEEVSYKWDEFERLAKEAAIRNGHVNEHGYSKTKVTVTFDDTTSYQCRLDLAVGDVSGFRSHAQQMIRYDSIEQGTKYHRAIGLVEHVEFLKTIQF